MELPAWLKLMKGTLTEDNDDPAELLFSDQIGSDGWGGGITAKDFGIALAQFPKKKTVKMMINCLGGEVGEGVAMYHMVRAHGNISTCVIGYAASMGSILAQAGSKRTMCSGTIMMIHNPSGNAGYGEEKDLVAKAALLKKLKGGMVDIYKEHCNLSKKEISDMMDATTFMTPKEALASGFIDAIEDSGAATASMHPNTLLTTYRQLASAPKCVVGDESGTPAQEKTNKQTSMKLLTATLAKLGLVASADLTDEQAIITDLTARFAPIKASADAVAGLRTELGAHAAALKLRVEGRVQKAIDDKKIKAERKDVLIGMGLSNEASLDFLDDIVLTAPAAAAGRRGAPPIPAKPGQGETAEAQLLAIREEMSTEKDPVALAKLAIKARELRGDGDMFTPTVFIPAAKVAASVAAK